MVPGRHDLTGLAGGPAGWPAVATPRRRPRHLCSASLGSASQSRPGRNLRGAGVSRRTRHGRAGLSNPLYTHPRRSGAYPSGRTPLRDLRRAFFPARPGCADSPRAPNLRPTLSPPLDPVKAAPADSAPVPRHRRDSALCHREERSDATICHCERSAAICPVLVIPAKAGIQVFSTTEDTEEIINYPSSIINPNGPFGAFLSKNSHVLSTFQRLLTLFGGL